MSELPATIGQRLIRALKELGSRLSGVKAATIFFGMPTVDALPSRFIPVKQSAGVSWLKSKETVKSLQKSSERCHERTVSWRGTGYFCAAFEDIAGRGETTIEEIRDWEVFHGIPKFP